jgi:uncharacterized repeat protein (TIGR01451 family)
VAWLTPAVSAPLPVLGLLAEVRVPIDPAGKAYHFVPATKLLQGQEIFYTLRIHNPSDQAMIGVVVVQPVPMNTRYVAGSASGAGAKISCSIDGGNSFAAPQPRTSGSAPCTHLRWQLPYPLAAKAVVLARFRAVFD